MNARTYKVRVNSSQGWSTWGENYIVAAASAASASKKAEEHFRKSRKDDARGCFVQSVENVDALIIS